MSQWHHEIYMPMDGIETAFSCSLLYLGIWGWYSYDCDDDHVSHRICSLWMVLK